VCNQVRTFSLLHSRSRWSELLRHVAKMQHFRAGVIPPTVEMRQRNKVDQALRDHGDPLLRVVFAPAMSVGAVARLARFTVPGLCLLSLYLAVYSSTTLVSLLLLGYAGVTQFFPGVVLGLFWKRANSTG